MAIDPGPHRLDDVRLVLLPGGDAVTKEVTPTFYQELGAFSGEILVSRHEFSEPWPSWEIHPKGDEFVYLLSGDADFVLKLPDGERVVRVNEPGCYVVVPKGTWHTARPREKTAMLFVTPGEGTLNRESPD